MEETTRRNPNTNRMDALIIIISFIIIGGGLLYFYNKPSKFTSLFSSSSSCTNDSSTTPPPPLPSFTWQHTGLITLWFDDAWSSIYKNGFPIMQKDGFVGAISVPVNYVCYPAFTTWEQLRTMQQHGWETTSHSKAHICDLSKYNDDITKDEIVGSKQIMKEHGLRTDSFVMPCGYTRSNITAAFAGHHPPIIETTQANYSSFRTGLGSRVNSLPLIDPYNLKSFIVEQTTTDAEIQNFIDQATRDKGWFILVFHQIDDSKTRFSVSTQRLQDILNLVKKSGLPVVLPSQVLAIH